MQTVGQILVALVIVLSLVFGILFMAMRYEDRIDLFFDNFSYWAKHVGRKKRK